MRTHVETRIAAVALVLGAAVPGGGDEVDRYVEARMGGLHIPGLSLAVVRDGRVVKARGYGFANLELRVPATEATAYEIGSNTKQFTAAAVMMLVEEGKIGLEDNVGKYFPAAPPSWGGITVRHLLTHTSGIQNHVAVPGYLRDFRTNLLFETSPGRDEIVAKFLALPREFQPGETWAYDNTGYYLLGIIVEKASGKPYWQFLDERIFGPLGMTASRNTDPQPLVPNRAAGYAWTGQSFENRPVLAPFIGFSAGSILSTVEDLAKWDAALYGDALLQRASRERMWTPTRTNDGTPAALDYGFGWFIDSYHGHRIVQHSGGTPGFSSAIYRFLDDRLTVIVLTNHGDTILDQLSIDIAGFYEPTLRRRDGADPDPQTSRQLQEAFSGLSQARHDPGRFTPPMALFLTTATGKAFWEWIASLGELSSFTFSDREEMESGRVLRYRVVLGGNPYWFSALLAKDGRIAQIRWW
jgi:CubicO group peptidase (beta-lactamase class C family)